MKITKIGLMKTSLTTAIIFLNTGCTLGLSGDEPNQLIEKPTKVKEISSVKTISSMKATTSLKERSPVKEIISTQKSTSIIPTPSTIIIAEECTDDPNSQSACQQKPIEAKELSVKKVMTQTGGEVHRLKSIQGKKITIIERPTGYIFPQFKNKIVILEMFGKSCSHCIKEIPIMNKLRRKYSHNVEIIALQVEGKMSKHQANTLLRRHRIHYPIIAGQTATNLQYQIQSTYGWTGILPFIMVIKDGVTEFTYRGQVKYNEINKDIRSLLR